MNKFAWILGFVALGSSLAHAQVRISGQPSAAPVVAARAKFEPKGNTVYHGASVPDAWSENGLKRQIGDYNAAAGKRISVVTWFASAYEKGVMTNWRQNYASNLHRVKRLGAASLVKFSTQDYVFESTKRQANLKANRGRRVGRLFRRKRAHLERIRFAGFSVDQPRNERQLVSVFAGVSQFRIYVSRFRRVVETHRRCVSQKRREQRGVRVVAQRARCGEASVIRRIIRAMITSIGLAFRSIRATTRPRWTRFTEVTPRRNRFSSPNGRQAPEKNQYNARFPGEVEWVRQFFAALETRYPRVKAISWFNWNQGDGDYRLQRVPQQAQAYAQDIASERYVERATDLVGAGNEPSVTRVERPGNEIILREVVAPPPPVVRPKTQRTLAERIKIEVVPIEQVRRGR
jgi:hypothetical protein